MRRSAIAGRTTSCRCWARSAWNSSASTSGMGVVVASRRISRTRRPRGVPPGSRVRRARGPSARASCLSLRAFAAGLDPLERYEQPLLHFFFLAPRSRREFTFRFRPVRILITGAGGLLGGRLCELLAREHDVTGADPTTGRPRRASRAAPPISRMRPRWPRLLRLERPDAVIHARRSPTRKCARESPTGPGATTSWPRRGWLRPAGAQAPG